MRAVVFDRPGPPEVLHVADLPDPDGPLLIDVVAAAVNPVDIATRSGLIPTSTPAVIGWDLAGIVRASSPDTGFAVGDRVVATTAQLGTGVGSTSEIVSIGLDFVVPAPTSMPLPDAAALPLAGLTGLQTVRAAGLVSRERVLLVGAQGSVGQFAAGFAAKAGVELTLLVRAGDVAVWEGVVDQYGYETDVITEAALGSRSFDVVIDCAGRPETVRNLAVGGRYVAIATFALPDPGDFVLRHVSVEVDSADLRAVVRAVDAGEVFLYPVAATYPFEEAPAAHRHAEAGTRGKVLLAPGPEVDR